MTKDLEATLNELGPEYRAVVARLKKDRGLKTRDFGIWRTNYSRAAALAMLVFLPCLFLRLSNAPSAPGQPTLHPAAPRDYQLADLATPAAVAEIVRTQQADGSWANDFLTRRNALALKDCADGAAQIAYRKAMRNLRLRGVL